MLTSFKEIDHPIYLFHDHIYHIFRNIFHYNLITYNEEKLVHPDFKPIINSSKTRLLKPIKEIVKVYYNLPLVEKYKLQQAINSNNSLSIFNDLSIELVKFDELHYSISNVLKDFFESLWNDYPQTNQMASWLTVKDHFDKLTHEDNFDFLICPFCGIDSFEPSEGMYREEYDHIIAKATYPFISVNFKLLFPCCKKCNQQEKKTKEILYKQNGERRLSFYPYDQNINVNSLSLIISLKENYNNQTLKTLLQSIDWEIHILRNGVIDIRDEPWDEVYGIKRRFTERIKRLEKQWYDELIMLYRKNIKPFNNFREDTLEILKYQIPIAGMGIIKYTYFNFIFNIPDIEAKLQQVVTH